MIDTLPLARDERLPRRAAAAAAAPTRSRWLRVLRDAWSEVKSLVRVEVADRPAAPLVPPQQQYFLRENLRLRLLTARIALLSHDDTGFKTDVTAANAWIKQYFDTRTKTVQALVDDADAAGGDADARGAARRRGQPHRAAHGEGDARARDRRAPPRR